MLKASMKMPGANRCRDGKSLLRALLKRVGGVAITALQKFDASNTESKMTMNLCGTDY
jgi:hypothetical protein